MSPRYYANHASPQATVTYKVAPEKRKVTYIFNTSATKSNLRIPYAVVVDGVAQDAYKDEPARIPATNKRKGILHEKVKVEVDEGSKVALYLNSDAHSFYRKSPVYEVKAEKHNIEVTITEKTGKHSDADTPTLSASDEKTKLDTYTAPLTGDIWMKVSHKYTADEADSLLPEGTGAEVKAAVKSIYQVLTQQKLTISVAATAEKSAAKLEVTFSDSNNPKSNIVTYDLLKDGLPRVHPAGYAAIFSAAFEAGVPSLSMSSAWRPSLGSIAHRAGLGIDVSYVGNVLMNREELRKTNAVDTTSVSAEEKKLFKELEATKAEEAKAAKSVDATKKAVDKSKKATDAAQKTLKKVQATYEKVKNDPAKAAAAKDALDKATKAADDAKKPQEEAEKAHKDAEEVRTKAAEKRQAAEKAWNDERNKNEPELVRKFREALAASPAVVQLFDPWFMDENTRDKVTARPNMQVDGNETLHAHHLHMTVREPKIL
jgi:hypothetical protein